MSGSTAEPIPLDHETPQIRGCRELLGIVLIVGSTLPLFALHLHHLWAKPHYQFFPLLLLGVAGLVWQRWPRRTLVRFRSRLGTMVLLVGLTVLAAGVLLFSPWLVAIAALVTAAGLILGLAEPQSRREWLPVWALLWILVPPPLKWDQDAITKLQLAVSRAASLTLDVFGVGHLMEGNVLVLPGHRLLVEEACSGINSLLTLLAITALFVVATRRPWIWSGLLLASSVCWAGLTNAARVVTVAVVQARYGRDLSSSWSHTLLGLATVGCALLMVVCTDRLLAFLLGPIVPADPEHELNPVSRAWNWCLGWSGGKAQELGREAGLAVSIEDQPPPPVPVPRNTGASGARFVPRWIVAGFVTLGILQLCSLAATTLRQQESWADAQRLSHPDLFRPSDLPATVGDWTQVNYTAETRQRDMGDFRQIWTYRSKHGDGLISVAYPFRGWHDVRVCYSMRGWKILASAVQPSGSGAEKTALYLEAQMRSPAGEQGFLLFSLVDQAGSAIDIPHQATWTRLVDRLAGTPLWSILRQASLPEQAAAFQVQALVTSQDALSAPQQQAVHSLFVAARQTLMSAYNQQRQVGDESRR